MVDRELAKVIAEMKSEGMDPTRGRSIDSARAIKLAQEIIRRTITETKNSYIKWFDRVSRTETQKFIGEEAPFEEAKTRMELGMKFTRGLGGRMERTIKNRRIAKMGTIAEVGTNVVAGGIGLMHFLQENTLEGEWRQEIIQRAVEVLPPDRTPGYFGDLWGKLTGNLSPYYSPEREKALRSLISDWSEDINSRLPGGKT
jgi:hypothetical protein